MTASITQQQQQTHERYIPPPLKILPEHQEQLQHSDLQHQQQYSGTNLRNYHANVFTTPGTATTTATATTAGAFREPQHVGDVVAAATAATAASTNGIFENGKVGPIQFYCICYFYSFHNHHAYQLPKTFDAL